MVGVKKNFGGLVKISTCCLKEVSTIQNTGNRKRRVIATPETTRTRCPN
jgi:hypothetical protein